MPVDVDVVATTESVTAVTPGRSAGGVAPIALQPVAGPALRADALVALSHAALAQLRDHAGTAGGWVIPMAPPLPRRPRPGSPRRP